MRRRGDVLAKPEGVSAVTDCALGGATLLLGDAGNAAAVLAAGPSALAGYEVSHIVCVASPKVAQTLEDRWTGLAAPDRSRISWRAFRMADWLRPQDVIDVKADLSEALDAVAAGIASASNPAPQPDLPAGPPRAAGAAAAAAPSRRAVLLHCDLGHNRSPTLALAYLVVAGLTLREAYRKVLRARPSVDPLPSYRRALAVQELQLRGRSSVAADEAFAMHLSELMDAVRWQPGASSGAGATPSAAALAMACSEGEEDSDETDLERQFGKALALREASIARLLTGDDVATGSPRAPGGQAQGRGPAGQE